MNGKEKLLITGGLGNLGSWLSEYFNSKFELFILSKNVNIEFNFPYTLIQADIADLEDLKSKLNKHFDYCIHAASYNESFHQNYPSKALQINTLGTRNLIEVLKDKKLKNFIYLSTFHVYGSSSGVIKEDSDLVPLNDYASTHLFAEYYLKQFYKTHNFKSIIFRLTNSYGAPKHISSSKWYLVLNNLVKSAFENQKIVIKGSGKDRRDLIWIGDVCSVIEYSLSFKTNDNVYNLSSGKTYEMIDLAKMVKKIYEKRYNKKIEIIVNDPYSKKHTDLLVINSKLRDFIDIKFNDKLYDEIMSIFDLLEKFKK